MDADEVQAAVEAADGNLNILGALSSITGLQPPAPPRRASDASEGDNSAAAGAASPSPSAPPAPGSSAGNSPSSGTTPATPSMIMTQQQLADLGTIMATAMKDAFSSDGTAGNSALGRATSPGSGSGDITGTASGSVPHGRLDGLPPQRSLYSG